MMEKCLFCSIGLLLLASVGAFFLYVPILTLVAGLVVMVGLVLMFVLGVLSGRRRMIHRHALQVVKPQVANVRQIDSVA
jgi:hypothetical protein